MHEETTSELVIKCVLVGIIGLVFLTFALAMLLSVLDEFNLLEPLRRRIFDKKSEEDEKDE